MKQVAELEPSFMSFASSLSKTSNFCTRKKILRAPIVCRSLKGQGINEYITLYIFSN